MALAPFFERVVTSLGGHLAVSRDALEQRLASITVGLRCADLASENDLLIAQFTANLLARLYPRLYVSGEESLGSGLVALIREINPEIEFSSEASQEASIFVGSVHGEGGLWPTARGWVAYLDHEIGRRSGATNPYSSAAAAALACAELFRRIFLDAEPEPDMALSLLNFNTETGADLELPPLDIGDVAVVGVGAIGNAAIWTLARHKGLTGDLTLIDPETLTLPNLQRYTLGVLSDVGLPKVQMAARELQTSDLRTHLVQKSLEEFADQNGSLSAPTVAVSVDNVEGRRAAQALLPRLVVNGWTGEQALGSSWHVLSANAACLACLYQPHGRGLSATEQAANAFGLSADRAALLWVTRQPLSDHDLGTAAATLGIEVQSLSAWRGKSLGELYTDVLCGAVPLDVAGVGRLETVPLAHQSALAGTLMAAELIKRTAPELGHLSQSETLVSWEDILRPPPMIWGKPRAREKGCICGDQDYQRAYSSKWGGTL